eukprot:gnl/TRDRNA2_/TRDRNA2_93783_c0_seq1.p1 gnl/TRDRNA2_/TRDRNA2_93783_c0~~gnl/TRDRNA2_/TRDRNA2_93783_c0_seq1.p1  ORF type:complete len:360 (-),score=51.16 gnl/TRDRNA2_/TRDRNA2_93783_c0_seq1:170-1249(-)
MPSKVDATDSEGEGEEFITESEAIRLNESVYTSIVIEYSRQEWQSMLSITLATILCVITQVIFAQVLMSIILSEMHEEYGQGMTYAKVEGVKHPINLFAQYTSSFGGEKCMVGKPKSWWNCAQKDWSWEARRIDMVSDYLEPMWDWIPQGHFFGMVSMFIFTAIIVKEFLDIQNYLEILGLGTEPVKGKKHELLWYVAPTKKEAQKGILATMNQVPQSAKIVVVLIAICRVYIAAALGFYGIQFLATTVDLEAFVLNTVALEFIFDLDELFYWVFTSNQQKQALDGLDPPEVRTFKQGYIPPFITLFLTVLITAIFYFTHLIPWSHDLEFLFYNKICPDANKSPQINCGGSVSVMLGGS